MRFKNTLKIRRYFCFLFFFPYRFIHGNHFVVVDLIQFCRKKGKKKNSDVFFAVVGKNLAEFFAAPRKTHRRSSEKTFFVFFFVNSMYRVFAKLDGVQTRKFYVKKKKNSLTGETRIYKTRYLIIFFFFLSLQK